MRIKPSVVAFFLACVLAALPPGASGAPAVDEERLLLVNYFGGAGGARGENGWSSWIAVDSDEPIARVTLAAPPTYPVTLGHAPGTRVGFVQGFVSVAGAHRPAGGELVVVSQTNYVPDPIAQACAPGAHAAVWRAKVVVPAVDKGDLRLSLELPVFVGRAAPGESLVLRFCPIWRTPGGEVKVEGLQFSIEGVFGKLRARGWNTWQAFVSPPLPTLAPDEARTFELRAHEPIPHDVTVQARQEPKSGMVVVSGRVTAVGQPESAADVTVLASRASAKELPAIGTARTNAAGEYSFRYRERESTVYIVDAFLEPRECDEPSTAPAGCASETVAAPPPSGGPGVRIRRPSEARLAVRARDQALAVRIGLKRADLPRGWGEWSFFSGLRCRAFNPDLRRLTATGWSESGQFGRVDVAAAESRVTVYASEEQARIAFAREARLAAAQCLAAELRREGLLGGARSIEAPLVGDERHAFRIATRGWAGPSPSGRRTVDLLSFRRGRVVVHLGFEGVSARVQHAVAAKLAARARRG